MARLRVALGALLVITGVVLLGVVSLGADPHPAQSGKVAVIGSVDVANGGSFPTLTTGPSGGFTDFTFTDLAVADVSAATLAGYDTVLLNVAGEEMGCDTARLTTTQKSDLVAHTSAGKKLVIYDSECPQADYSWLPVPFTTSNPGAAGASGTFNLPEDGTLSSADPADPHFVDPELVATDTDAVGDANIFTTFDPRWCVANTATNALGVNGPVRMYAQVGTGLVVYNGLDVDDLDSSTAPDVTAGPENLAKLWLQELQQPPDGTGLACAISAVGVTLSPTDATLAVGASHTLTAHVTNSVGDPRSGVAVAFSVTSGPNAAAPGTCSPDPGCSTDVNGEVTFAYVGSGGEGADEIRACFPGGGGEVCSAPARATWTSEGRPSSDTTTTVAGTSTTVTGRPGGPVSPGGDIPGGGDSGRGDDIVRGLVSPGGGVLARTGTHRARALAVLALLTVALGEVLVLAGRRRVGHSR